MLDQSFFFTSELPKQVFHPLVPNKVGSTHHGHGHQQTENEQSKPPVVEQSVCEAIWARGRGLFGTGVGPDAVCVDGGDQNEPESEKAQSGEERDELHSKSSSRI